MEPLTLDKTEVTLKSDIETIFKKYYKLVYNVVRSKLNDNFTAEDLTQDVFYEFWNKRDKIVIHTSLKSYLIRSAINTVYNHFRKKKLIYTSDIPTEIPNNDQDYIEAIGNDETDGLKIHLYSAIDRLPPKCKEVFVLSRTHGLTYEEISEVLNISKKTVDNHIAKALKRLRVELNNYRLLHSRIAC